MSAKSAIEWTDATWNPITGCTKVSQGCKNCYAEREWPRLQHLPAYAGRAFTDVRCHPDRLEEPLHWRKPRKIFVCHNADLFHEAVPDDFLRHVFHTMWNCPQHTFQILTKRADRMLQYLYHKDEYSRPYWKNPRSNIWLGVSVEDQATADERIPLLLQTPAAVRWISAEPLLGPIDLSFHAGLDPNHDDLRGLLNWVVAGGESGPQARPSHPDWFRSLRDQCRTASVPFFFKQWGQWVPVCAQYPATDAEHNETEQAGCVGDIALEPDGTVAEGYQPHSTRTWLMNKVGKKAAGRMLDGREWNEYPS